LVPSTLGAASSRSPPYRPADRRSEEQTSRSRQSRTGVFGAVANSHLGSGGLDLMLAITAPHDQPHIGRRGSPRRVIGGLGLDFTTVSVYWRITRL
jgi:hypothetical protein